MRVLVVSHNVFSETESMGRTLASYFAGWDKNEIAQFYIHSEVPTSNVCENYFNITDKQAIKSIFTRKCGSILTKENIQLGRNGTRTDEGLTAKIYQKARRRTPLIYLARNAIWKLSGWKNRKFKKWIDDFDPQVVFFASGDYAFMYRIARWISKYKKIPLVVSCMDDYYFQNKNSKKFLGKIAHGLFMKQVRKTMERASAILSICDKMTNDYSALFGIPCYTLHTPSTFDGPLEGNKKKQICYLGNLGYQRHKQLVEIGRALKEIDHPELPKYIDVYSSESRPEVVSFLSEENGIVFHGSIPYDQVKQVIADSLAVIHTESFDEGIRKSVRYSVSTKIADSLASGTCLFAYGPSDVASIEYVKENQVGVVANSKEELKEKLVSLGDEEECLKINERAVSLAKQNHNKDKNVEFVKKVLQAVLKRSSE